ncbi:hypothetical protein, partial [Lacticaseibacillus paracasei]|uniref:hypothetical protein n=1 Tax=Lacticaseibacillus paracasei TaxID=1597 RepID=UPI0021A347E6
PVAKKFRYSKSNSLTYRDLNLTGRRKGTCGLARVAARHMLYAQVLHDLHDRRQLATNGV